MVAALNTVETGSADLKATMVLCEGGVRWTRGLIIQVYFQMFAYIPLLWLMRSC